MDNSYMNKYLPSSNWRKANLNNNHFSSIKMTVFKREMYIIMQSEKKVALIHFWNGIKYNVLMEGSLAVCIKNHKNDIFWLLNLRKHI